MHSLSQLIAELNRLDQDLIQELSNLNGDHAGLEADLREGEYSSPVASKLAADVRLLAQQVQDLRTLTTELLLRSRQLEAGPLTPWSAPGLAGSPN